MCCVWSLDERILSDVSSHVQLVLCSKCACSCFQSTVDIKRLVSLSSTSSAGSGHGHGQPQPPIYSLPEKNGFPGRIHHLPDLIQQSHHSPSSSTTIPSSSSSSSFPSSSSHASPAVSPQNPLDNLTAIEVCHPHIGKTKSRGLDGSSVQA